MEQVRRTFFDPLATSKDQVREILQKLPVGSAHPFSPERLLLCRTHNGIEEIDISSHTEDFFFNAVDLGEMGEILLERMAGFAELEIFKDFQIMQASNLTFKVPIVSGEIAILAVSKRRPTYYDLCFADASCNACCWKARRKFPGIIHSGDITKSHILLHHIRIDQQDLTEKELCVFISGYEYTPITSFLGTNPALLVANHVEKVLYIVPVPLDAATIGKATICCPLVIKRDEDFLICSILPAAATDNDISCFGDRLESHSFSEAIQRADFAISAPSPSAAQSESSQYQLNGSFDTDTYAEKANMGNSTKENATSSLETRSEITEEIAVFTTDLANIPSFLDLEKAQLIIFGTGIEFQLPGKELSKKTGPPAVVLPCIFGSQLQGPFLLATGTVPSNVPFANEFEILDYYKQLKNAVVVVDDRMTDNARNLATTYRINALFIVKLCPENQPKNSDDILLLLNSANINAVTALAGPQSLILIQISEKYYFYRGLANRAHINTSRIAFGSDVTAVLESVGMGSILDPRIERIITLGDKNSIILPTSGQFVQPQNLQKLFEELSIDQIKDQEEDIIAAVPQLQMLLDAKDLQELSKALVFVLSSKINSATAELKTTYTSFLTKGYNTTDPESAKKKNKMLGELRKTTKDIQIALEPLISALANMMSAQTTSKRTHDLKRLVRQTQIQANVEATKSMTFNTLAGYLETYAGEMGVMLLNIETTSYSEILGNMRNTVIDASSCCSLDSRILHLEGFDAGIILEQSQAHHDGPLRSTDGPSHPILALPYLSQESGSGSMLAWVCWDEFVNLKSPYTVRWMEKCNEAHIAALRIIMRSTFSRAVASRDLNIQSNSTESGHLMSALLMAAMSKLAAMRTTAPVVSENVEDTVTKLMRGLFGNLLTIAGSGVRPLSMVWQLFGLSSQLDLPQTDVDWIWYETVVALYPYTEWPLRQFYDNLEKLLDKAIVRVVTKNENQDWVKVSRTVKMAECCKLRNIQLDQYRKIITVLMRAFKAEDTNIAAISVRLLERLPQLDRQSEGFTCMIRYIQHLARGGQRRIRDDIVAANIYTSRSATFAELKIKVKQACEHKEWSTVKESCQAIMDKHAEIASFWHVEPESVKVQNMKVYKSLLDADFGDDASEATEIKIRELHSQVVSDAETWRVPWQVGKKSEFGNDIEPLDEGFLHEILTGENHESPAAADFTGESGAEMIASVGTTSSDEFTQFTSSVRLSFISTMQKKISAEDVCRIVHVPVTAMRVFIKALNPEFVWEDLGENFKVTVLGLLENRSNRIESRPTAKLLRLKSEEKKLQIEG
ncbi:hypothetical protein N7457_008138 [Penicillium paradoxum]|uniref:uncharacterized protein n=1 Tax=Penicillium paradoxum TaxID=176176 RepID=UPI002548DBD1|nr:uncharacterized protein N7457_008138 [Penicillium paradoxum]KAJ5773242.1 hypothetical protein N7457_008138 [Penicillium paradoxum]